MTDISLLPLVLGVLAAALVVWWMVKKVFKLAFFAALAGAAAWIWFFAG